MTQLGMAIVGISAAAAGLSLLTAIVITIRNARRRRLTPEQARAFAEQVSARLAARQAGRADRAVAMSVIVHLRDGGVRVYDKTQVLEVDAVLGVLLIDSREEVPSLGQINSVVVEVAP